MKPIKSMTAYGRSSVSFHLGRFTIEIQSLNRRFLEINISLPRFLTRFEIEVRKKIAQAVGRGQINVSIFWQPDPKHPIASVTPNLELSARLKEAWVAIADFTGVPPNIDLSLLARQEGLISVFEEVEEENLFLAPLLEGVGAALSDVVAMREKEGSYLAMDLMQRVEFLETLMGNISLHASDSAERYREKLIKRLKDLALFPQEEDERVLKEIAIYSDRVDIDEEMTRFKSHLSQLRNLLTSEKTQVKETWGKTMDFWIQELFREINTIGSKSSSSQISAWVVEAKSQLEKMREQIQNIE